MFPLSARQRSHAIAEERIPSVLQPSVENGSRLVVISLTDQSKAEDFPALYRADESAEMAL